LGCNVLEGAAKLARSGVVRRKEKKRVRKSSNNSRGSGARGQLKRDKPRKRRMYRFRPVEGHPRRDKGISYVDRSVRTRFLREKLA